jgi:hypothetical protein
MLITLVLLGALCESCPSIPPPVYANHLETNTSPGISYSTEMPTPNPVVDSTYPTDLHGREPVPELDPRNQLWGTSSYILSSIDLDELLGIQPYLPEEGNYISAVTSLPASLDPGHVIDPHARLDARPNADFSTSVKIPIGGVKHASYPFTSLLLPPTAAEVQRMPYASTLPLLALDLPSSRAKPTSSRSLLPNIEGTSAYLVPPSGFMIPRELLDIGYASPRPALSDKVPHQDTIRKLVYAGFMQLILNEYPSVTLPSPCGQPPRRIRLIELVARREWMPHVMNWFNGRREGYAWEPLKEATFVPKLKPMEPIRLAKSWATGAWTKRKEASATPRVEPNPTLEKMLAPSNKYTCSSTIPATDSPAPLEDKALLTLPYLTYDGGHVVTKPGTLFPEAITSSNALAWQNQARSSAVICNSMGDPSSSSSTSRGASCSFVLPRLDFFHSSPFALPVWDMRSATEAASMMSTFEQSSIFALPPSSNAHDRNPVKAEELVAACEDKDEPEEHLDGDEDDLFEDKE